MKQSCVTKTSLPSEICIENTNIHDLYGELKLGCSTYWLLPSRLTTELNIQRYLNLKQKFLIDQDYVSTDQTANQTKPTLTHVITKVPWDYLMKNKCGTKSILNYKYTLKTQLHSLTSHHTWDEICSTKHCPNWSPKSNDGDLHNIEVINFLKGNRNSTVVFIWDQHGLAETCNQMTDTLPTLKKNILTGAAHGAKHSYLLYPSVAQRPSTVFDPSVKTNKRIMKPSKSPDTSVRHEFFQNLQRPSVIITTIDTDWFQFRV